VSVVTAGTSGRGSHTPTAWSWWTRPRAVSWGGVVYVGGVGKNGHVYIDEWANAVRPRKRHHISRLAGEQDDHNNPAIVLEPERPPLVFYARHFDSTVRYRRGTANFVPGAQLGTWGAERTISIGAVTYAVAIVHGTDLYLLCRGGTGSWRWSLAKSTDWGLTWTTVPLFSCVGQFYVAAVLAGDRIRCAMSTHPVNGNLADQRIYYAEIVLSSGDVVAGGATLGNISGTNLPIPWDACEVVGTPASGYRTWAYDVSDAANPEVAWSSFYSGATWSGSDAAAIGSTSKYHYSVRSSGTWASHDIIGAGARFAASNEPYLGGAQFPVSSPGGSVTVARETSGTWRVERQVTANGGVSWTPTLLVSDTRPAVRAWPVEQRDGTAPPFPVAVNYAADFANWNSFRGNVGGARLPD
jgi:hypothetical protein